MSAMDRGPRPLSIHALNSLIEVCLKYSYFELAENIIMWIKRRDEVWNRHIHIQNELVINEDY